MAYFKAVSKFFQEKARKTTSLRFQVGIGNWYCQEKGTLHSPAITLLCTRSQEATLRGQLETVKVTRGMCRQAVLQTGNSVAVQCTTRTLRVY